MTSILIFLATAGFLSGQSDLSARERLAEEFPVAPLGGTVEWRLLWGPSQYLMYRLPKAVPEDDVRNWGNAHLFAYGFTFTGQYDASVFDTEMTHVNDSPKEWRRSCLSIFRDRYSKDGVRWVSHVFIGVPLPKIERRDPIESTPLSPKDLAIAKSLVWPGGVVLGTALNRGTGLILVEGPKNLDYAALRRWSEQHRLGSSVPFSGGDLIQARDLGRRSMLPQEQICHWGWARMAIEGTSNGPRVLVGFPVDYESESVLTYQRIRPINRLGVATTPQSDPFYIPSECKVLGKLNKNGCRLMLLKMPPSKWTPSQIATWYDPLHVGACFPPPPSTMAKGSDLSQVVVTRPGGTPWGWADIYLSTSGKYVDRIVVGRPLTPRSY